MTRKITGWLVAAASLLLTSATGQAATPRDALEMPPLGKWQFNYDADGCKAIRSFGDAKENMTLMLLRTAPADGVQLTLAGNALKTATPFIDLLLHFDIDEETPQFPSYSATAGTIGKTPLLMVSVRLDNKQLRDLKTAREAPPVQPEQEAAVTSLTFRGPSGQWYRLRTGSMKAIMGVMRNCTDDLVKFWGYDPDVQKSLQSRAVPRGHAGDWLTTSDYPSTMLRKGQMAVVDFRLDVDETGKVGGCHITRATMPAEASDVTCRILAARAKFEPAIDASGKPVKTYYSSRAHFVIP